MGKIGSGPMCCGRPMGKRDSRAWKCARCLKVVKIDLTPEQLEEVQAKKRLLNRAYHEKHGRSKTPYKPREHKPRRTSAPLYQAPPKRTPGESIMWKGYRIEIKGNAMYLNGESQFFPTKAEAVLYECADYWMGEAAKWEAEAKKFKEEYYILRGSL